MAGTLPRIKLRVDTVANWQRSISPLYEGEVAISYEVIDGKKTNFKIKIGHGKDTANSCLWQDAADLTVAKLSDQDMQILVVNVIQQLGDVFVKQEEFAPFIEAVQTISSQVQTMQNRLNNRVKADVSDATLVLSIDD